MKSKVEETRYPKTADNHKNRQSKANNVNNDRNIVKRNVSSSWVRKSESKKTLVETLDLDDAAGYGNDEQQ